MRKIIGLAVSCLVACSLFLILQPAFGASYDGAWTPSHDTVMTFEYSSEGEYSFGIYEFADLNNSYVLHDSSGVHLDHLKFEETNNGWDVKIYQLDSSTQKLEYIDKLVFDASSSNEFGFFFTDSNNNTDYVYGYEAVGNETDVFSLTWGTHVVTVHDAAPTVPIPTAMLLLGSGLVGLAGFKRKMDN